MRISKLKNDQLIRKKAVEAVESAEMEILAKASVEIPAEKWEEFEMWLNEPPKVIPEVKELLNMKPLWE